MTLIYSAPWEHQIHLFCSVALMKGLKSNQCAYCPCIFACVCLSEPNDKPTYTTFGSPLHMYGCWICILLPRHFPPKWWQVRWQVVTPFSGSSLASTSFVPQWNASLLHFENSKMHQNAAVAELGADMVSSCFKWLTWQKYQNLASQIQMTCTNHTWQQFQPASKRNTTNTVVNPTASAWSPTGCSKHWMNLNYKLQ